MTGQDFVAQFAKTSPPVWEREVVRMANEGGLVPWDFVEVKVPNPNHDARVYVTSDVVSVGDKTDFLRMPLTPMAAQAVADANHALLPTTKIAKAIWAAAPVKLEPTPVVPNLAHNSEELFAAFVKHNQILHDAMALKNASADAFVTGHKKDIIIVPEIPKGHVVIYGWFKGDGTPVQGKNERDHDAHYVDYSHGVRLVKDTALIDGEPVRLSHALRDPSLFRLFASGEVPFRTVRYGEDPGLFAAGWRDVRRPRKTKLFA